MESLSRELRVAIRVLRHDRATTVIALVTLALAIGANTAIFGLLDALVLRPLPVPHPEQLTVLGTTIPDSVNGNQPFSLPMFKELTRHQEIFSQLFIWNGLGIEQLEAKGQYVVSAMAEVSGNYYQAMQISPALGRFIEARDVNLNGSPSNSVAVISYRAWQTWYRGDPHVLGQMIRSTSDNHPFTIIGVEPKGFTGLITDRSTDITTPILAVLPTVGPFNASDPNLLWLRLYARMKPGVTIHRARANLTLLWPRILNATPPSDYSGEKLARFYAHGVSIESAANGTSSLRKQWSGWLNVLFGLVAAVLLVACLNLSNVTLARAVAHAHESGVRTALGAAAWQLIYPALLENLLLSFTAGVVSLPLAFFGSRALVHIAWNGLAGAPLEPSLDWRVLLFTAAAAVITAILFVLPPALYASRIQPLEALQRQSRSVRSGARVAGKALLIAQIAGSLVLVTGALLFGQALRNLHTADLGYRRDHLLTMLLFPQPGQLRFDITGAYAHQLFDAIRRIPGVESVTCITGEIASETEYLNQVFGALDAPAVEAIEQRAGPDFFHVMGMHLLAGREFDWRDDAEPPQVAVISQSMAEKLFPHRYAVGRTIWTGPHSRAQPTRVIGVVNSASLWKIEDVHPLAYYVPLTRTMTLIIRTNVDPHSIRTSAERVVRSLGHQYAFRTMTLDEQLDRDLSVQRLSALLAGFFGVLTLLISAIGLYGLMSFHVARRTSELGIRIALGARHGGVVRLVMSESLSLAILGCGFGVFASLLAARYIRSLLFGVSATDPVTLFGACLILILVAAAAAFIPSKRAASVDPAVALRAD